MNGFDTSLSYVQQLPIDNLRIDRSFVQRINGAASTWTLLQAIVALAHSLGMSATAEGGETAHQLDLLKQMGCDFAQRFFLGMPAPPHRIARKLARQPVVPCGLDIHLEPAMSPAVAP